MNTGTRVLGASVALLLTAVIVAGSHAPMGGTGNTAVVRVAWSARPERIERCRRLSPEEIAALPTHMRRQVECEGTTARYRLEVTREGALIDSVTVRGGGLRHDREVYVSREITVPPGRQTLAVRFVRIDSSTDAAADPRDAGDGTARRTERRDDPAAAREMGDRAGREEDERRRRRAEAIPARLTLDTTLTLISRTVILVTYDPLARRLVAKAAP